MPGVCAEYGLAYKVTETHLNVRGQQRVKYASQLLSKTCANSRRYLGEYVCVGPGPHHTLHTDSEATTLFAAR